MIIPRDWLLWRVKKNLLYKGVQCQANGFSIFSWEQPENSPIVPDICLLLVLPAGAGPGIITSLSPGPWVSGQHLTHHPDRSQLLDLAQGWLLSGHWLLDAKSNSSNYSGLSVSKSLTLCDIMPAHYMVGFNSVQNSGKWLDYSVKNK